MGYFSELDLINRENYIDRSYHGFEEQPLWRYFQQTEGLNTLAFASLANAVSGKSFSSFFAGGARLFRYLI